MLCNCGKINHLIKSYLIEAKPLQKPGKLPGPLILPTAWRVLSEIPSGYRDSPAHDDVFEGGEESEEEGQRQRQRKRKRLQAFQVLQVDG